MAKGLNARDYYIKSTNTTSERIYWSYTTGRGFSTRTRRLFCWKILGTLKHGSNLHNKHFPLPNGNKKNQAMNKN
jgi:hypothetical protein